MKHFTLILLIILLIGCSANHGLNNRIDKSQRESLINSPFKSSNGMTSELKIQNEFRKLYEKEIDSLIKKYKNDTIILTENYNFICVGCPSDYVQLFVKNKLITFKEYRTGKTIDKKNFYKQSFEILSKDKRDSTGYKYVDLDILLKEIKKGNGWNKQPENYGTDECFDGGHTLYTVFFPNGKIESMYMRCWTKNLFETDN